MSNNWINIEEQRPEEGQLCEVIDPFQKVDVMEYHSYPSIILDSGEKQIIGRDLFQSKKGWLTDDVEYWRPKSSEEKET